jgi:hypothetical protein
MRVLSKRLIGEGAGSRIAPAPANNGIHPTADTPPLMYHQRGRAAGDAWR